MNKNPQKKEILKDRLLDCIEKDGVCPRPKMFFQCRECLVWFLWLISVVIGAFAVAVSLFVLSRNQYALYEATHDNFLTFAVEALPVLWLIVFGLMSVVAIYNLRHTAKGYRYPVSVILASSVVVSLAMGAALQLIGFGYNVDNFMGKNMDRYMSQEKVEAKLWQNPVEGRLMGRQVLSTLSPTTTVVFEDINGERWQITVEELQSYDLELLASSETVKLIGKVVDDKLMRFHACGTFPQMAKRDMTMDRMSQERNRFVKQLYHFADKGKKEPELDEDELWEGLNLPPRSICASIRPVRHMP